MNVERLTILAEFLDTLPDDKHFNMLLWAIDYADGQPICGTEACAAGWAATIPSFREAGYQLSKNGEPFYLNRHNIPALQLFFDLSYEQTESIFIKNSYLDYEDVAGRRSIVVRRKVSPADVAARIRELIWRHAHE